MTNQDEMAKKASPEQVAPVVRDNAAQAFEDCALTGTGWYVTPTPSAGVCKTCNGKGEYEFGEFTTRPCPDCIPSAETIDTPEFCSLVGNVVKASHGFTDSAAALTALIDARIAAARQEGAAQALSDVADHFDKDHRELWTPQIVEEIHAIRALRSTDQTDGGADLAVVSQPVEAKGVRAYCKACQSVGMSNCGNFDECDGATCITCHRSLNDNAAARIAELERQNGELVKDAERYRWLRMQDWFDGPLCVLRDPKRVLTSGNGLGADCPSRDRLDTAIDAAIASAAGKEGGK